MRRGSVLLALVASLLLGLAFVVSGARAQDSTPTASAGAMAGHPIVGTWMVTDPSGSPSVTSFTADGVVTDIEADGGAALGTWVATGDRTAAFTMILIVASPEFSASIQINVEVTIDETGNAGTGRYTYTAVLPDGTVAESGEGTVTVTRLGVQGLDSKGTPIAGYPTWNPNEGNGTPEATPAP